MRLTLILLAAAAAPAFAAHHDLKATVDTVVLGNYSAQNKPALTIASGDTVTIQTISHALTPAELGVPQNEVPDNLTSVRDHVKNPGPGRHYLTGPVYIEGAEPGDVLEVRIQKINLDVPYAQNNFRPTSGFLPEDYPYAKSTLIRLDRERMIGTFGKGLTIPLHPFFGSMGVAPPPAFGKIDSGPPGIHGGNLDNKELTAGSTLYLPVHVKGALFETGDGHAGQGDGEVDLNAMETSLTGTFQFILRKDMHLTFPRAETPTHYIVMAVDEEIAVATKAAVREMIQFLVDVKGLTKDDAYVLSSIAADFRITQLVDTRKGVHGMILKSIFPAR